MFHKRHLISLYSTTAFQTNELMFAEQSWRSEDHRLGMKKVQHCSKAWTAVRVPAFVSFSVKVSDFPSRGAEVGLREPEPAKPSLIQTRDGFVGSALEREQSFHTELSKGIPLALLTRCP